MTKSILSHLDVHVRMSEKIVLFGAQGLNNVSPLILNQINRVIAVAKLSISKVKFSSVKPVLQIFEEETHIRDIW